MQTRNRLQSPRDTSLVPGSEAEAFNAKSVVQPRREKTLKGGRMSAKQLAWISSSFITRKASGLPRHWEDLMAALET